METRGNGQGGSICILILCMEGVVKVGKRKAAENQVVFSSFAFQPSLYLPLPS